MSAPEPMATDLCERFQIEKPSRALLRDDLTATQFAEVLADADCFSDAVRVVAFLLPARESVWWAIQCARQNPVENGEPEIEVALTAAEKWVREMREEDRYAARTAAEEAGLGTAAGCAAMAAFACGDSIGLPDQPAVTPDPALVPSLVSGSIIASSIPPNPADASKRFRSFLQQGVEMYKATVAGAPSD